MTQIKTELCSHRPAVSISKILLPTNVGSPRFFWYKNLNHSDNRDRGGAAHFVLDRISARVLKDHVPIRISSLTQSLERIKNNLIFSLDTRWLFVVILLIFKLCWETALKFSKFQTWGFKVIYYLNNYFSKYPWKHLFSYSFFIQK